MDLGFLTVNEFIILLISAGFFVFPGYLIVDLLFPKLENLPEKIVFSFSFMIILSIFIGFILSNYELLNSSTSLLILIIIYIFSFSAYFMKKKVDYKEYNLDYKTVKFYLGLFLIFWIVFQIFYQPQQ